MRYNQFRLNLKVFQKQFLLYFLASILTYHLSFGQDNFLQEPSEPSPNAASLGKYGAIPVSHHTGVPNISIPLHTITDGQLQLPINLSYHSSGVKVDELASWVGLGWSINAGGMISRTVMGAPDEGNTRGGQSAAGGSGWYKNLGIHPGLLDPTCLTNPNTISDDCRKYYFDAANGTADTEPDIFNFNFGGFSGKFFFDKNRIPHLQPEQDIKIEPNYINDQFESWVVTAPDGTRFYFGGNNATEVGYSDSEGVGITDGTTLATTTWYLTKIESLNANDAIYLNYVPEKYSFTNRNSHSITLDASCIPQGSSITHAPQHASITCINGLRLNQITTKSGNTLVDFEALTLRTDLSKYQNQQQANLEAKRLDKIKVQIKNSLKEFEFGYQYFSSSISSAFPDYSNTTHADIYRLKLVSVQEKAGLVGGTLTSKPPHQFIYNETETMARRLSLARDHWGYYNGNDGNTGLVPDFTTPCGGIFSNLADREPDENKMKAWILERIFYPTGGYSQFTYEPHKESSEATEIIGGLRVKQIVTNAASDAPDMIQNFSYPFGLLYAGAPNYVQQPNNNPAAISNGYPSLGHIISSVPRGPLRSTQGYHIGYSVVIVEQPANGKSTYRYLNTTPGPINTYPPVPTQYLIGSGTLVEESHTDEHGIVRQRTTNTYITDFSNTIDAKRVSVGSCIGCAPCGPGLEDNCNDYALVKDYSLRIGRSLLIETESFRDDVTTSTTFQYSPEHNSPIVVSTRNSDTKISKVETDYSKDRFIPNCSINPSGCLATYYATIAQDWENLQSQIQNCRDDAYTYCKNPGRWIADDCNCCFSVPFPSAEEQDAVCEKNCRQRKTNECVSLGNYYDDYRNALAQAQEDYLACRATVINQYESCLEASLNSLQGSDRALAEMIINNVVVPLETREYVENSQTGGSQIIYDYNSHNHLVQSEANVYLSTSGIWERRMQVKHDDQSIPVEYIREHDIPTSYLWGYNYSLPVAKITGASIDQVTAIVNPISIQNLSGLSLESALNALRSQLPESFITTYIYNDRLQVETITDPNGLTSTYEYDDLGRLTAIRDMNGDLVQSNDYKYSGQN